MTAIPPKKTADLKVIILGSPSVGKTSLITRYVSGSYEDTVSTIGAALTLRQWGPFNVALWDTAGAEQFAGLSAIYARGAGAAILAYDVTDVESFRALRARFLHLLQSADKGCLCVVVAMKTDLLATKPREVPREDGVQLARELNENITDVPFYETSSLQGLNVARPFEHIFRVQLDENPAMAKKLPKKSKSTIQLADPVASPPSQCC